MTTEQTQKLKQIYIDLEPEAHPEDRAAEFDGFTDEQKFLFQVWHLGETVPNVAFLRQNGHRVKVNHSRALLVHNPEKKRYDVEIHKTKNMIEAGISPSSWLPRGGATEVRIELKDGRVFEGESVCSPQEAFAYRTGLYFAMRRALEGVEI